MVQVPMDIRHKIYSLLPIPMTCLLAIDSLPRAMKAAGETAEANWPTKEDLRGGHRDIQAGMTNRVETERIEAKEMFVMAERRGMVEETL